MPARQCFRLSSNNNPHVIWTALRKEISEICEQLDISDELFAPVSIQDWQKIQNKIFEKFTYPDYLGRISERLKGDTYSIQSHYIYPFDQLLNLIDHSEKIWLFLNETVVEFDKYWFCDGYIKEIVLILRETMRSDEVYIVSKKYEWLLCSMITTILLQPEIR